MKQSLVIFLFLFLCWSKGFPQSGNISFTSFKNFRGENIREEAHPLSSYAPAITEWMQSKKPAKMILGFTKEDRAVEAYYFPGKTDKKALVIGGMHGSELSSIEVARKLIEILADTALSYYNVIVIPVLFPDNAEKALATAGKLNANSGRYTNDSSVDPNRQMPELGKTFEASNPVDVYGRIIEKENQFLLQLIQDFMPSRIVNLHAIKDTARAGIYADPRTDHMGCALGFESDSILAVAMARFIESNGGKVPGNQLRQKPTALYYMDPEIAPAGFLQERNLHGSPLPANRGYGVSLGSWAATAVLDENGARDAARLFTLEFPGYKPSFFYEGKEQEACALNVQLYALALKEIFLSEICVE
jgi:hypothetical protein